MSVSAYDLAPFRAEYKRQRRAGRTDADMALAGGFVDSEGRPDRKALRLALGVDRSPATARDEDGKRQRIARQRTGREMGLKLARALLGRPSGESEEEPNPLPELRATLASARDAGVEFDVAWAEAMAALDEVVRKGWSEPLDKTRWGWEHFYNGGNGGHPGLDALAALRGML